MTNIPVALQMFTLRKENEKDFKGVLEKVADIGFDGVEFAGYGGLQPTELKRLIDHLGLQAASSHIPLPSLENELEKVIETQKILGSKHIVCPHLPPERRTDEDYHRLVSILNEVGRRSSEEGITLSYHNHDFELHPMKDGRIPLEFILAETNPDWVKAEFDIYWLTKAEESPSSWLDQYQARTPLVHLKDMTTDGEQFFAELGTGGVDVKGVLGKGQANEVEWWVVEQDQSKGSALESIQKSFRYLQEQNVTTI